MKRRPTPRRATPPDPELTEEDLNQDGSPKSDRGFDAAPGPAALVGSKQGQAIPPDADVCGGIWTPAR